MQQLKAKLKDLEALVSEDLTNVERLKEVRDSMENLLLHIDQVTFMSNRD